MTVTRDSAQIRPVMRMQSSGSGAAGAAYHVTPTPASAFWVAKVYRQMTDEEVWWRSCVCLRWQGAELWSMVHGGCGYNRSALEMLRVAYGEACVTNAELWLLFIVQCAKVVGWPGKGADQKLGSM